MSVAGAVVIAAALQVLPPTLPEEAAGWKAIAPADRYDADTIFQYIDGLGEVYLAYGMASCLARRYAAPDRDDRVIVDVFEMASAADAFGIFTHSREGEPVAVGQGASFGYGTLLFWKGRDFVSVTAERDDEGTRAAVMALGRAIAAAIPETGTPPPLLERLPKAGLDEASVVYLRHPRILEAHVPVGAGNPLGLGPQAPAVVGRYRSRGGAADLVVVEYTDAASAVAATTTFGQRFLDGMQPARRDGGWFAAAALGEHACAYVLRAPSREEALALLEATKGGPP
jgi:uncharacterized protein DUF6599